MTNIHFPAPSAVNPGFLSSLSSFFLLFYNNVPKDVDFANFPIRGTE